MAQEMDQTENQSNYTPEEVFKTLGSSPREAIVAANEEIADIDPRQWLTHDDSLRTTTVVLNAGRIKIAGLTEKEGDRIRKASETPVPGNPKQKQSSLKKLRVLTVALSLNKAYGWVNTPNQITPDQVEEKLMGEITTLVNEISKISGYSEDGQAENLSSFLQVS